MLKLIVHLEGQSRTLEFEQETVSIGRSADCDLPIDDKLASRQHAEISKEGSTYVLQDLASSNGTRVNGQIVDRCTLVPGDRIEIGSVSIHFEAIAEETSQPDTSVNLPLELEDDGRAPAATAAPGGPPCLFVLTDSDGNMQHFEIPFVKLLGGITIGRSRDNDISIPDDGVSTHHVKATYTDGSYFVADMGSTNGTRINGRLATGGIIKTGDQIQMGSVRIDFFANVADACFDKESFYNLEGLTVEDKAPAPRRSALRRAMPFALVGVCAAVAIVVILVQASQTSKEGQTNLLAKAVDVTDHATFKKAWEFEGAGGDAEPTVDVVQPDGSAGAAIRFQFEPNRQARPVRAFLARSIPIVADGPYRFRARVDAADLSGGAALQIFWLADKRLLRISSSPPAGRSSEASKELTVTAVPPPGATRLLPVLFAVAASGKVAFHDLSLLVEPAELHKERPSVKTSTFTATPAPSGALTVSGLGDVRLLSGLCLVGLDPNHQIRYTQDLASGTTIRAAGDELWISGRLLPLREGDKPVDFTVTVTTAADGLKIAANLEQEVKAVLWGFKMRAPRPRDGYGYELFDGFRASELQTDRSSARELLLRRPRKKLLLRFGGVKASVSRTPHDRFGPEPEHPNLFADPRTLLLALRPEDGRGARAFTLHVQTGQSQLDAALEKKLLLVDRLIRTFHLKEAEDLYIDLEARFGVVPWLKNVLDAQKAARKHRENELKKEAEIAHNLAVRYGTPQIYIAARRLYQMIRDRSADPAMRADARTVLASLARRQSKAAWRKIGREERLRLLRRELNRLQKWTSANLLDAYLSHAAENRKKNDGW